MPKNPLQDLPSSLLEPVASRFRALGEISRLQIISALHAGEKGVNDLVELTGLSQPNVSKHLSILVSAGLVGRRREGINIRYRIVDKSLNDLCSIVCRSVLK